MTTVPEEHPIPLRRLFSPRVIAVAGASTSGRGPGNRYIEQLREYGYEGEIYVIHPSSPEVDGLPAFRSLSDVPRAIDYAYVAVPGPAVPGLLSGAKGNLAYAQVMSSGFGETSTGAHLEAELIAAARAAGVRVIGPNCLGLYSPRGRVTFIDRAPTEPGPVGVISQSGGLGVDIIRRGKTRGIRFSGLVTIGNAVDIGPDELLEFYLDDPDTRVIGLYLESVRNGRGLFQLLRRARSVKPVVLLKGGRTAQGQRAAASHTGAMVSDDRVWSGLARQTGTVLVDTLDEFLDVLLALQLLQPAARPTGRVALFGNGGGTSVLASDAFARAGLQLPLLPDAAIRRLEELNLPPGTSVLNPIDAPAGTLEEKDGKIAAEILQVLVALGDVDAIVMHLNLPVMVSAVGRNPAVMRNLLDAAFRVRGCGGREPHFVLVLRSDGEPDIEEAKRRYTQEAVERSIPVYGELSDAAGALKALAAFEATRGQPRGVAELEEAG